MHRKELPYHLAESIHAQLQREARRRVRSMRIRLKTVNDQTGFLSRAMMVRREHPAEQSLGETRRSVDAYGNENAVREENKDKGGVAVKNTDRTHEILNINVLSKEAERLRHTWHQAANRDNPLGLGEASPDVKNEQRKDADEK
jgi:hypothetical protein